VSCCCWVRACAYALRALLGEVGGTTHRWKALVHGNKNMAFKRWTCVGIDEKWEVQCMYDPHFLAKGLKPVSLRPRVLR
jgi:hypothetical protein